MNSNSNTENNWDNIISNKFENNPNKVILHNFYNGVDFLESLSSEEEVNTIIEIIPDPNDNYVNQSSLHKINDKTYVSFIELDKLTDNFLVSQVTFYFQDNLEEVNKIIEELENYKIDIESDENKLSKFNSISISGDKMIIQPISVEPNNIDIEEIYNNETIKSIKKIKKRIKKSRKGLTIFYGDKGTGKTEMMKHLISLTDKSCLFIPSNTLDITINNPEFKSILQNYQDIILTIDDCEFFTNGKFSKMNYVTNNLVQLVDSIISDSLNLHILLIFNILEDEEIDETLLDCNNLLDIIEFDKLDFELSTELSKTLGFNRKYKTDQRLVDIFNNRKDIQKNKIGL